MSQPQVDLIVQAITTASWVIATAILISSVVMCACIAISYRWLGGIKNEIWALRNYLSEKEGIHEYEKD